MAQTTCQKCESGYDPQHTSFTKSLMTWFFFFLLLLSGHMVSKVIAEKECAHVMPAEK